LVGPHTNLYERVSAWYVTACSDKPLIPTRFLTIQTDIATS